VRESEGVVQHTLGMEIAADFVGGERGERGGVGRWNEGAVGEDVVEEVRQEWGGVRWVRFRVCRGEEEGEVEGAAFVGG